MTATAIADLERTLAAGEAAFDRASAVLERSYAPGKWTARQLLLHLTDAEPHFLDRGKRILAEAEPRLLAWDENRWQGLLPPGRDLALARDLFRASRRALIELARLTPAEGWTRTGVHSEAGVITFAQVVAKAAHHASHHLGQIDAIVAGRAWIKAG